MDPKATGKYHHGDLRNALLEKAIVAIDEHGPTRFSLRAVTQELNVSHAAAYRHFRNRAALLQAVSIEGMQRLTQALVNAARISSDPSDTLRRCALAYVEFGVNNPGLYQVMFSEPTQQHAETRGAADSVMAMTAQILTRAGEQGAVRPRNALEQGRAAWAMLHGLVDLELRKQLGDRSHDEILEHASRLLEIFFEGLFKD